jgi:DNA-binding MarR family transcriptional regulator
MENTPTKTNLPLQQAIDRFWETIPPVWNTVRSHLRSVAAEEFGMTVEQFHSLRLIRKGYRTASEIAQAKQISRPAVSQAVETLVQKGLVSRQQSQADRRYVQLELTDEGARTLDQIFGQTRRWMESRMGSLSQEDLQALSNGMAALGQALMGFEE